MRRPWTSRVCHTKEGCGGMLTVAPEIMWTQHKVFKKFVTTAIRNER